jgi:hypothetical protein
MVIRLKMLDVAGETRNLPVNGQNGRNAVRSVSTVEAIALSVPCGTAPDTSRVSRIAVRLRLKALQSIAQGNALCSRTPSHTQALKGRNQPPNGISPRRGLGPCGGYSFRRALPYAIDNKAFSLNLTAMGYRNRSVAGVTTALLRVSQPLCCGRRNRSVAGVATEALRVS